jgi:hypothetical protein
MTQPEHAYSVYSTLDPRQLFEEQIFEFIGAGRPVPCLWNGMVMAFRKTA